jgi:F0F1-type ATP synthase assembly protein I
MDPGEQGHMNSESPDRLSHDEQKQERRPNISRNFAPFLTMGFQLAAAVLMFLLIGHWIDKKFGIEPFGKLLGVVIGSTGGFVKFFKTVASITAEEEKQRAEKKREN